MGLLRRMNIVATCPTTRPHQKDFEPVWWAFGAGKVYGLGKYFEKSFEILQIFVLIPTYFSQKSELTSIPSCSYY